MTIATSGRAGRASFRSGERPIWRRALAAAGYSALLNALLFAVAVEMRIFPAFRLAPDAGPQMAVELVVFVSAPEQREQMRQRMQNMTPEQREQMRQRMQNMTPEQREQMRAQHGAVRGWQGPRGAGQLPEELRPVMEQIRSNWAAARQEAEQVLTTEQRTRLRELAPQRRGGGERPNPRPADR
jgi:Spy/CpxP family protein refolding chaperone